MKNKIVQILLILFPLTILSGIIYSYMLGTKNQILSNVYLAFFYMPLPFYSLIILSLKDKENYISKYIKFKKFDKKILLYPIILFLAWAVTTTLLTVVASNIFPDIFGKIIMTNEELLINLERIAGKEAASSANLPPSPLFLLIMTFFGAITAGFSINMIFALGEEVLWRGFLWDKLGYLKFFKRNFLIGFIWGVWHIPVVLQGHNYGVENGINGALMFVVFCMIFSLLFGLLMEKRPNAILAAAMHGMFNAFAGVFIILLNKYNPFLDGAVGVLSMASLLIVSLLIKYFTDRKITIIK